jgi:UDP-N-acetylmuramoylalanine--D-glutamate ligase
MDRYGKMESYIAAKAKIFKNQTAEDFCVLNADNELVRGFAGGIKARVLWFSAENEVTDGACVMDGKIVFMDGGSRREILPVSDLMIPGKHNLENALAAVVLACVYGIDCENVAETLRTFKGVEHRIEFVREVKDIVFINDSKGTNPDASRKAIEAMDRPTVLILGGYDKKSDFVPLFRAFGDTVKAVIVLGSTASKIIDAAQEAGYERYIKANGFEDAVLKAYSIAEAGDVVLLSPACASWDMFEDFEHRGREFKRIVEEL